MPVNRWGVHASRTVHTLGADGPTKRVDAPSVGKDVDKCRLPLLSWRHACLEGVELLGGYSGRQEGCERGSPKDRIGPASPFGGTRFAGILAYIKLLIFLLKKTARLLRQERRAASSFLTWDPREERNGQSMEIIRPHARVL